MKNLKKVLALALAMVMMFGMMTVAFAADEDATKTSDLVDFAEVTNKAEVSLLVDLGVINGTEENGQMYYKPASTVTRAEMAKMIYYILEGDSDASVYAGNSRFKDAAGTWAEGYINYLATPGVDVLAGDDLGNVNPRSNVTVAEAAKMLLVAAGWDAEDRNYVGSGWSSSVMRDAARRNLVDGVDQSTNEAMTRDNAAKMIFNGLNLSKVEAIRKQTFVGTGVEKLVDSYSGLDTTLGYDAYGLVKVTGLVKEVDGGKLVFNGNTSPIAVGNKVVPGDASMAGQMAEFYVKAKGTEFESDYKDPGKIEMTTAGTFESLISSTAVAGGVTVLATETAGVDWTKCFVAPAEGTKADGTFVVEKDNTVNYYLNGEFSTLPTTGSLASGKVVEFCDINGNGKADLVRAYDWKVAEVAGMGVETTTDKNGNTFVTVDGIVNTAKTPAANVVGYEGLEAGDVVLYYTTGTSKDDVTVIEKAETFTGNITSKHNKTQAVTINGTSYSKSGIANADTASLLDNLSGDTKTDDYTWALDKNGDICFHKAPEGSVETKTALVLATGFAPGTSGGLLGSATTGDSANAQLLFTDGTNEIVKVVKVGNKTLNAEGNGLAGEDMNGLNSRVVKYSVNDKNEYTLEIDTAAQTIAAGEVSAKSNFVGSLRADSNTLFVVGKKGSDGSYTWSTFTGYASLPGFTMDAAGQYIAKDGRVTMAFLTTEAFAGDVPAGYIYIADNENYETVTGQTYVEVKIVDEAGNETTAMFKNVPASVGLYKVKSADENGVITALESKAATVSVTNDVAMSGGIFTVGSNTYEYDNNTKVIIIELTDGAYTSVGVVKAGDISAANGLEILVNGEAEKLVDTIYVIRNTVTAE